MRSLYDQTMVAAAEQSETIGDSLHAISKIDVANPYRKEATNEYSGTASPCSSLILTLPQSLLKNSRIQNSVWRVFLPYMSQYLSDATLHLEKVWIMNIMNCLSKNVLDHTISNSTDRIISFS